MGGPSSGRWVRTIEERTEVIIDHIHGSQVIYPVDITTPYSVSSAAGAGVAGSLITIFAADALSDDYDIHYVFGRGLSTNCAFRVRFYVGATPRFVGETEFIRSSNFEQGGQQPIITGDDHEIISKSEILQADAICSVAGPITLLFSVGIHKY